MSGELNYRVKDVKKVIDKIQSSFNEGNTNLLDGYSVESEDWRFNIRPSNTEPLLRLNLEAKSIELVNRVKGKIEDIINE